MRFTFRLYACDGYSVDSGSILSSQSFLYTSAFSVCAFNTHYEIHIFLNVAYSLDFHNGTNVWTWGRVWETLCSILWITYQQFTNAIYYGNVILYLVCPWYQVMFITASLPVCQQECLSKHDELCHCQCIYSQQTVVWWICIM